jgi:hypothetical protein
MAKPIVSILLLALICVPLPSMAGEKAASLESRAYDNAVAFLLDSGRVHNESQAANDPSMETKGPNDSIWVDNLRTLALSPTQEGDKYLAKLRLFGLDASIGEDYSCASSHRVTTHRDWFLKQLRHYRDHYEAMSPCESIDFKKAKNYLLVYCITKEDYTKYVSMFEAPEDKNETDSEADCSYMFK